MLKQILSIQSPLTLDMLRDNYILAILSLYVSNINI